MSQSVAEVMCPFAGRDLIGLPDLAARLAETIGIDFDQAARNHAVSSGVIRPAPARGPNGRYQLSRDDAVRLVVAGIVAAGAGLAIVTALRMLLAFPADGAAALAAAGAAVLAAAT